jgi:hypothetical protein
MKKTAIFVFFAVTFLMFNVYAEDDFYPDIIRLPDNENATGIDGDVSWKARRLNDGDTPVSLFGDLSEDAMRFNRLDARFWKEGTIVRIPDDTSRLKGWTPMPESASKCERMKKCVVIGLAEQFLGIYSKGKLYSSFPVSTGMLAMECGRPKGARSCKTPIMATFVRGRYFKVFSYPYRVWMWFALDIGRGRFIHSGNLPGRPDSHGCVRLFRRDARQVYKQIRIGAKVFVENDISKMGAL